MGWESVWLNAQKRLEQPIYDRPQSYQFQAQGQRNAETGQAFRNDTCVFTPRDRERDIVTSKPSSSPSGLGLAQSHDLRHILHFQAYSFGGARLLKPYSGTCVVYMPQETWPSPIVDAATYTVAMTKITRVSRICGMSLLKLVQTLHRNIPAVINDGQDIGTNVPLSFRSGHIGYVTVSVFMLDWAMVQGET